MVSTNSLCAEFIAGGKVINTDDYREIVNLDFRTQFCKKKTKRMQTSIGKSFKEKQLD